MGVELSIGELADAAGMSRRAVRFYVARALLPPPTGVGRGRHYNQQHLETLKRIEQLQSSGHSLDAIGKILRGDPAPPPAREIRRGRPHRPRVIAELWTRLAVAPGVELHLDASRHEPAPPQLDAMRAALRSILNIDRNARESSDELETT